MRKVIFASSVSLDGFIEGPNGELDWLVSEEEERGASDFLSDFDTIFYGRKAYEKLALPDKLGPHLTEAEREFYYLMYGMRKYVFSRSRRHVAGNGMVISDNLEAEVKRIREEAGKDILFCGGADIMKTFAELDLIDEYCLTVYPVKLRAGKPLFSGIKKPLDLFLVSEQNLQSGLVILQYMPQSRLKNAQSLW